MNWKTLLVIGSLLLTTGLTACNKEAAAPDATKVETKTETTDVKPVDGAAPKTDAKPADAPKGDAMKPADSAAPKGDAAKPADGVTKTTTTEKTIKPAEAPKKP